MTLVDGRARSYHDETKHSLQSVYASRHFLDWEIKPFPFKVYPDAPVVPLPREVPPPAIPALTAMARAAASGGPGDLDLAGLAAVLFFSAGLTRKKAFPGGVIHFRAAATTGALYEVEVYVVAGDIQGLEAGVYHFSPADFSLRRLRGGDHRGVLAEAAGQPGAILDAPATLVLSAIYWRNTWKYQARAYRHFFWDAGTLTANVLAVAAARALPAALVLGFADEAVNHLLGLDSSREGALALVPLGRGRPGAGPAPRLDPGVWATIPLSSQEVDYPLVRAAYAASSLADGAAARAWSGRPETEESPPAASTDRPGRALGETILRRGSTREFAREAIEAADLDAILDSAVRPLPLDAGATGLPLVDVYVLVHDVTDRAPGAYVYDRGSRTLRLLRAGEFRAEGGHLCLGQALGADASAVVFFLCRLDAVLARLGDRGYRAVNFEAGLLGGRMYLAAYALGLGATGLTFYDDDVVTFFSPDAAGKDAIFVTALGRAARPGRSGHLDRAAGKIHELRPGDSA